MSSYRSMAARVGAHADEHPERYCGKPWKGGKCRWRVREYDHKASQAAGHEVWRVVPCGRHGHREESK